MTGHAEVQPLYKLHRPYETLMNISSPLMWLSLSGSGGVRVELLLVHPVGPAVLLPGGVPGASVCAVRLWFRDPRGEKH